MQTWLWMIFFLVFGTAMFLVGYYTGHMDAGKAPNPQVWQNVRKYGIDANKEVNLHGIDMEHEETMAMIERGCFDNVDFSDSVETEFSESDDEDDDE